MARPGADLYWLIAVALDCIQDPGGAFPKVLMQGGRGEGQHLPSCAASQGLQLCPQLPTKVANLLQGHVLHQVWQGPAVLIASTSCLHQTLVPIAAELMSAGVRAVKGNDSWFLE